MDTQSPQQKRQAKTRQAILDTALALISEKGLEKFSLREVARRVEYSPAGLYEYFGSREEILKALAYIGGIRLRALMRAVPKTLEPREYLVRLCLAYIDYGVHNIEYFKLMSIHPVVRSDFDEAVSEESPYNILLEGVQRAIDEKIISPQPDYAVEEIAYTAWAFVHGVVQLKITLLKDFQADFDSINKIALETFFIGLG